MRGIPRTGWRYATRCGSLSQGLFGNNTGGPRCWGRLLAEAGISPWLIRILLPSCLWTEGTQTRFAAGAKWIIIDVTMKRRPSSGRRFECLKPEEWVEFSIRIMTYNIHRWAGRDQRLDTRSACRCHRHVASRHRGPERGPSPGHDFSSHLCAACGTGQPTWACGTPSARAVGWTMGRAGKARSVTPLLSRYPLRDVANAMLPRLPSTKQRSLLCATVSSGPLAGLTAFVTHLDHAFEGTRLFQIRACFAG